ncbi:MAG: PIN domain-containing protein [Candidatus Nanoarchaeia archaeon]|nr:PIN domain-containing protein [Candidatus Nanoarchaeia archaeon]
MQSFYIDSCIWLNLFKKEGDPSKGKPYWEIAEGFIEKVMFSENKEIIYSDLVLKEIKFNLNNEILFKEKLLFLKREEKFKFIKMVEEDKIFARKLESKSDFTISFYDCLHIAICKRLNFILITRDNLLIDFASDYIKVQKPENLLD